jgi:hypothetical protein
MTAEGACDALRSGQLSTLEDDSKEDGLKDGCSGGHDLEMDIYIQSQFSARAESYKGQRASFYC